jgi:hypothetical protein
VRPLPGISDDAARSAFIEQLIESLRRVRYVAVVQTRDIADKRADPSSAIFDPLRAAILLSRADRFNDACWLVFLSVHFGKHSRAGWRYVRDVYGRLGDTSFWDWHAVTSDVEDFRRWLHEHQASLKRPGEAGGFGNHRKYQSLDAESANGTGAAVETYIEWVGESRDHRMLFDEALAQAEGDPRVAFDTLYGSMRMIASFGRLARFDYLTMLGKLGLIGFEAGSTYMEGATGPVAGARLLCTGIQGSDVKLSILDSWLVELESYLDVGMQVIEDALCNWQKSPMVFKPFRG